jgi:hypothetical protein
VRVDQSGATLKRSPNPENVKYNLASASRASETQKQEGYLKKGEPKNTFLFPPYSEACPLNPAKYVRKKKEEEHIRDPDQ